ncbi:hypothetical protein [Moheibacter lacus]|uniref:DUF4374 domain-containing protein n=1 Tax=Moheibacter lacus TaxID=2745851 RepID=A0A838ZHS8_9FLAO|nr:hypothetical protein [Moheibacter lacus]MBA5628808.1 hypothetical protein [Moheibacter lacus]
MKKNLFRILNCTFVAGFIALAVSCSDDDNGNATIEPPITEGRWITIAGAVHDETPGDGNGGTILYAISKENAKDPSKSYNVFENGHAVNSFRTARLQSSLDGTTIFNVAYGGDNGGEFYKYQVNGGQNFVQTGGVVNISQYVGTAPRWVKLIDDDQTGVAGTIANAEVVTNIDGSYAYTRGTATVVSIDMENVLISNTGSFEVPLTPEEEALGHYIWRIDGSTLNQAGNKIIIGTWMRKTDPATGQNDTSEFQKLGAKSIVLDYPSLSNPQVITSTQGFGDTSGYRYCNNILANDGYVYQSTQRERTGGSKIIRINSNNQYDNSYVFSLDQALGITNSYIENWKYVGNGIALVMYSHEGSVVSAASGQPQSFLARVDLNAKTATQLPLDYDVDMYFFQYQGFVVDGFDVYVAGAPVGKDGFIYIINSQTGAVTKGAKLINTPGNHFMGAF